MTTLPDGDPCDVQVWGRPSLTGAGGGVGAAGSCAGQLAAHGTSVCGGGVDVDVEPGRVGRDRPGENGRGPHAGSGAVDRPDVKGNNDRAIDTPDASVDVHGNRAPDVGRHPGAHLASD